MAKSVISRMKALKGATSKRAGTMRGAKSAGKQMKNFARRASTGGSGG